MASESDPEDQGHSPDHPEPGPSRRRRRRRQDEESDSDGPAPPKKTKTAKRKGRKTNTRPAGDDDEEDPNGDADPSTQLTTTKSGKGKGKETAQPNDDDDPEPSTAGQKKKAADQPPTWFGQFGLTEKVYSPSEARPWGDSTHEVWSKGGELPKMDWFETIRFGPPDITKTGKPKASAVATTLRVAGATLSTPWNASNMSVSLVMTYCGFANPAALHTYELIQG